MTKIDVNEFNRTAWNLNSKMNIRWSTPVSEDEVKNAKLGDYEINLGPFKKLPSSEIQDYRNKRVLLLAGGGGQQGPILAAAGFDITIVDISDEQITKDKLVANNFNLDLKTIVTSADDLSMIRDESFELILNPLSNLFFENLDSVWNECSRVLVPGGEILYSFMNPLCFLFDKLKQNKGEYYLKYSLPYSDHTSLSLDEQKMFIGAETPLEFSHSLESQINGLLMKGFQVVEIREFSWERKEENNPYFPEFIYIRAKKDKS